MTEQNTIKLIAARLSTILTNLSDEDKLTVVQNSIKDKDISDEQFMEILYLSYIEAKHKNLDVLDEIKYKTEKQKQFLVELAESGGTLKQVDYANMLGTKRQALTRRIRTGQLITVQGITGGTPVIPAFQLDETRLQSELYGLNEINTMLFAKNVSNPDRVKFWLTPQDKLDDVSPREFIIRENSDEALNSLRKIVHAM